MIGILLPMAISAQPTITYTYENGNRVQRKADLRVSSLGNSNDSLVAGVIPAGSNEAAETAGTTDAAANSAEENGIRVFPNPAHTELCVEATGEIPESIVLCEPGGKEVMRISPSAALSTLNVTGIAVGQYVLRVKRENGEERFLVVKK
ncbi:MAG: T9SS type A sorting domain-containing protein [Bacteroidetes bacterium]|nr:T9SS type A sorting domain-containing protein [Bacteroidota bacterium]